MSKTKEELEKELAEAKQLIEEQNKLINNQEQEKEALKKSASEKDVVVTFNKKNYKVIVKKIKVGKEEAAVVLKAEDFKKKENQKYVAELIEKGSGAFQLLE